ncbi:MAG: lipopolysaccharide biosynthesis protein [Candidatus Parcubacteria bacterium]|nr:lipopolysaccharide biosynthesis protein [Candidatus Parcubacteria bacterium]
MGYSKRTIVGISWVTAFRAISRVIAFVRVIILARLLAPSQFGIFGIASMALTLLEILTETGINIFLVQEKKDIDSYVNDAWLVSIIRGFLITCLIIITAPFITPFFKIQESLGVILLISMVPLIKGFINPSIVKFQKELQFGREFYFRMAIFVFDSLVSVIVSLATHSVLGLVAGLISGSILEVILSFILIKPTPKLKFDWHKINEIFHRGKWVTLYGIFNYAASEGDNITIGKILGPGALGIYQMGYTIATLPVSEIADVTNKVTFPVYSRISQDLKRLKKGFYKTLLLVSASSILVGLAIFLFPRDLFILIFGQKWESTMTVLRPLAIFGVIRAISGTTSSLFLGVGRQNYVAGMTFLRLIVLVATILPFTMSYGIVGASYAVLLSGISEVPIVLYYIWLTFRSSYTTSRDGSGNMK